jgi:hypothetical protein
VKSGKKRPCSMRIVLLLVCGAVSFVAVGFLMFGSSEVAEPKAEISAVAGAAGDSFQQSLLAALSYLGNDDPTITANVRSLMKLQATAPEVLKRFFATSPSWRVFKEHGSVFATRRWMIGSQWEYELHGYYTGSDTSFWSEAGKPGFQTRFTVGFSGKPWAWVSRDATQMNAGQTRSLVLSIGNQMHVSRCIINAGSFVVEIFEESEAKERRLTKAALSHFERELSPLASQPDWKRIRSILPDSSIKKGDPTFKLRDSFQPGLYDSEIWINPGEPGMIYLKAFEATNGTPLSVDPLKTRSNEWIGWSDSPKELFFSNTHFTIYEGDWGDPYTARFEIWFAPDSGGNDRKLMEKTFEIEGWQR